jgi:predicted site-specific integrase-resolvase
VHLFRKFTTEMVVVSEFGHTKKDSEEVLEDIISVLHCYSMKMYSKYEEKPLNGGRT